MGTETYSNSIIGSSAFERLNVVHILKHQLLLCVKIFKYVINHNAAIFCVPHGLCESFKTIFTFNEDLELLSLRLKCPYLEFF